MDAMSPSSALWAAECRVEGDNRVVTNNADWLGTVTVGADGGFREDSGIAFRT
jgi:hypothetical protein